MVAIKPKLPDWLRIKHHKNGNSTQTQNFISGLKLNTICEEGNCPNRSECFSRGTAAFLILGEKCTRNCLYCNVNPGKPLPWDCSEPLRLAQAVKKLNLSYAVLTSPARDDLPDGGASAFVETVQKIKELNPACRVELLIPDFKGNMEALKRVVESQAEVIGHNLETVEEIFPQVRIQGNYSCSLQVLKQIKILNPRQKTKSSLMLGLGETKEQVEKTLREIRQQGCDFLSLGQYLQPSEKHFPVSKYYTPQEFEQWKEKALALGFSHVESGPLVRSSYHADTLAGLV